VPSRVDHCVVRLTSTESFGSDPVRPNQTIIHHPSSDVSSVIRAEECHCRCCSSNSKDGNSSREHRIRRVSSLMLDSFRTASKVLQNPTHSGCGQVSSLMLLFHPSRDVNSSRGEHPWVSAEGCHQAMLTCNSVSQIFRTQPAPEGQMDNPCDFETLF
jgi:hypothetical protein